MGLPWLVVLRGSQIRLYPSRPDVGVGRKRQAETYTELDLALLGEDRRRTAAEVATAQDRALSTRGWLSGGGVA